MVHMLHFGYRVLLKALQCTVSILILVECLVDLSEVAHTNYTQNIKVSDLGLVNLFFLLFAFQGTSW